MATKKAAAAKPKGGELVPATGTAMVNYEDQMRKDLEALSERTSAPGGDKIRITRDKKFKLPDGTTNPGPLSVVVIDFVSGNYFYDRPYKDGDISPPACFALGTNPRKMVPSSTSPVKQADKCIDCPNDTYGSKGKGKACSNQRLLAVMAPTEDVDAPFHLLSVSPTGIKAWDAYVETLKSSLKKTSYGVITDIYFDPNSDFQSLRFGNPQPLPANVLANAASKITAARARLLAEPDVSQYAPLVAPKGKKK